MTASKPRSEGLSQTYRRLVSVEDFRCFSNWKDDESQRPHRFGQQTVIYGPNGSGKSTLSDIFLAIQAAQKNEGPTDARLKGVTLELTDGTRDWLLKGSNSDLPLTFVFNKAYVTENLGSAFEGAGHGTPLYVLGEEKVLLAEATAKTEGEIQAAQKELTARGKGKKVASGAVNDCLDRVRSAVEDALSAYNPGFYNKTRYDKRKARKLLEGQKARLDSEKLQGEAAKLKLSEDEIPENVVLSVPGLSADLTQQLKGLATFDVAARVIDHLKANQQLANWAQKGLALHQAGDRCGFCNSEVEANRLKDLQDHFNDTYSELEEKREALTEALRRFEHDFATAKETLAGVKEDAHPHLAQAISDAAENLATYWAASETWLESARAIVRARENAPFEYATVSLAAEPNSEVWGRLQEAAAEENQILKDRRANIDAAKEQAAQAILAHIAASHFDDYERCRKRENAATAVEASTLKELKGLKKVKSEQLSKQRDSLDGKPLAAQLTNDLRDYHGHGQFSVRFERHGEQAGFAFLRNGAKADHLSEGERNAIALLYFLNSLDTEEIGKELERACVVIDDPVSSLDQDAMISAFSFLTNRLRPENGLACAQFMILTHNFEFFWRLKEWVKGPLAQDRKKASSVEALPSLKQRRATLLEFGVHISELSGEIVRSPVLREVGQRPDSLLSEYFFLFQQACEATQPESADLVPLAGNAARRLLESFMRFKSPSCGKFGNAVAELGRKHEIRPEIVRIVADTLNGASHKPGFDMRTRPQRPSTVVGIRAALQFMRSVDPGHYEGLCKATNLKPHLPGAEAVAVSVTATARRGGSSAKKSELSKKARKSKGSSA